MVQCAALNFYWKLFTRIIG